jgi:hypothetical protein
MTATTIKSNFNNETFTIEFCNSISILIRDQEAYFNATKLRNDINDKESITKKLINIFKSPDFKALERILLEEIRRHPPD